MKQRIEPLPTYRLTDENASEWWNRSKINELVEAHNNIREGGEGGTGAYVENCNACQTGIGVHKHFSSSHPTEPKSGPKHNEGWGMLLESCRKMKDDRDRSTLPYQNRYYSKGWNQALNWVISYIENRED